MLASWSRRGLAVMSSRLLGLYGMENFFFKFVRKPAGGNSDILMFIGSVSGVCLRELGSVVGVSFSGVSNSFMLICLMVTCCQTIKGMSGLKVVL